MFPAALPPPPPPTASAVSVAPAAQAPGNAADSAAANAPRQRVASHGYHYLVIGNHLLTTAAVGQAVASGATPRAVVGALKQAYENHGYFLVALVATRHGDAVTVHVVQGRITGIEGPGHLAAFFTGLKGNAQLRKSDVIRRGILAQAYAATNGEQPQVSFHPAPQSGGSILRISQTPLAHSHPFGASLVFGNFGNRYAAHDLAQAQVSAQHNGLTAQIDYTRALPGLTPGTRGADYQAASAKLSMVTPAGVFALDGSKTRYHLGKAFAPLFPAGRIEVFGATATQLLSAGSRRRWSLHEGMHRVHDTTTVFSGNYALNDRRFNLLDVGTAVFQRFDGLFHQPATLNISGDVKFGFARSDWGFTRAPGAPASHFNIYTASIDVTQSLAGGYALELDASGQATPDTLPSYEQWVLGGINNLTAYLRGTLAGDRGYLGRIAGQGPKWQAGPLHFRLKVFLEHGASRFSFIAPGAPTWRALTDVGAGLSLKLPVADTRAVLAWAKPVGSRNVSLQQRRGQRAHLFFSLRASY